MRTVALCLSMFCTTALGACVITPPLEQAAGFEPEITIKEIVERVKCELSDAFDQKVEDPRFLWLTDWTVKADLTLIINDTAGITPTASRTSFRTSAVNFDAGPSSFPATAARSVVQQFFTFGFGASLNAQAVRTETVSFTLALDELKLWRQELDRRESDPAFPLRQRTCYSGLALGLTGNLGLKEWVDSAFFPVEAGALQAGIHPPPLSQQAGKAPAAAANPEPSGLKPKLLEELTYETIRDNTNKWLIELRAKRDAIENAGTDIKVAAQKITTSDSQLTSKISVMSVDAPQFRYVLSENIKRRLNSIREYRRLMHAYVSHSAQCTSRMQIITKDINKLIMDLEGLSTDVASALTNHENEVSKAIRERYSNAQASVLKEKNADTDALNCATLLRENADDAATVAAALPNQIDPPVDSILHSLQFVVTYGGSVSPSWTLIQWKGPALSGSLAGATGIRTHTLLLALGPRSGGQYSSPELVRLIQNQTVRALAN